MKATVNGFGVYRKNTEFKVVYVSIHEVNEFTGLPVTVRRTYVCNQSFHFINFIGKECEVSIAHSDKLNLDVCMSIKEIENENK